MRAPVIQASEFGFSFSGGGITASGTISTGGPGPSAGSQEVTNITGTYRDANDGINGSITGLYQPASYSIAHGSVGYAFNDPNNISFDDLFYPAANSPNVCGPGYPWIGGAFDVFGVLFDVTGGYVAALWSNGDVDGGPIIYASGNANRAGILDNPGPTNGVLGEFSFSAVPEPGSVVLIGVGLLGFALAYARKRVRMVGPAELESATSTVSR